jgi:phage gpG-like protein
VPTLISFTFFGDAQLDRRLERMTGHTEDARPAFEAIRESFLAAERRQFSTQGGYASGGWAPLSPRYAEWKARHYPGQPILRRTDELFRSLTEGPEINVIEPQFALFGSAVPYGEFHQHGTARMPMRKPVELPEALRRRWVKILQRWIITGEVL